MTRTTDYYADYEPKNLSHFRDMINQFRKAKDEKSMRDIEVLWILSRDVDRQDIVVAAGRVARERGFE